MFRSASIVKRPLLMFLLILLLTPMATVFIEPAAAAAETVYIRVDGSVDPPTAPIQRNGNIYTFTSNINDSLVIQRDNVAIDGASYTLQGPGGLSGTTAISLNGRSNVTIANLKVTNFYRGIILSGSSYNTLREVEITEITLYALMLTNSSYNTISGNKIGGYNGVTISNSLGNTIFGNDIRPSMTGITLSYSSNNTITSNNMTWGLGASVYLGSSDYNSLSQNHITNSAAGITLTDSDTNYLSGNNINATTGNGVTLSSSSSNAILGNYIANNYNYGVWLNYSFNNNFYHNNLVNTKQVFSLSSTNVWDYGYPSGGNYWLDYSDMDGNGDGIGDTPYIIDPSNQDRYPLITAFQEEYTLTVNLVGSGSVTKNPNQARYSHGTVVVLTAIPNVGWSFTGWSGNLSGSNNPVDLLMMGNKVVTATFQSASNSPPYQPQLAITPNLSVKDEDNLVVSIVGPTPSDPDGDTVTYTYRWLVNVGTGNFVDDETVGRGNHNGNTVPALDTTVGDVWRVEVTPTDEHGAAGTPATTTWQIVVDATNPIANAGPDRTVNEDTQVAFDGSASSDNVGIANYRWTFTDGTLQTLTGRNPTYFFANPGTYTVTLNVTDAAGNWATDTVVITVSLVTQSSGNTSTGSTTTSSTEPQTPKDTTIPVANAGTDKTTVNNKSVSFDAGNSSDNVGIVSYAWDFGDGTTATGKTVTHTYNESRAYTVTLTVKDAAGNSQTDSLIATVQSDMDGDGDPDLTDADGDNDGIPNAWETEMGLDPFNAQDAALDADNDGLTSLQEYLQGKNPNVPDVGTQPQQLYLAAAAMGGFAAVTAAALLNLGGLAKSFDSAISKMPLPDKIKEFIQLYGEKLFETVDKAKLEALEKGPVITKNEVTTFTASAVLAMIVFGSAEASGIQNFLTPSGLVSFVPAALVSVCVVILVGELFEALCARTCHIYRQFNLWMYGTIVFLVSGLVFLLPFGSPGITRYQTGEISPKTKGLLVLSKMFLLLTLAVPFAALSILGFKNVGDMGLMLTLMTVCFSLLPLKPLAGKAIFDYRKAISVITLVVVGILFYSFAASLLPITVYLTAGATSAALAAIALFQLRKTKSK